MFQYQTILNHSATDRWTDIVNATKKRMCDALRFSGIPALVWGREEKEEEGEEKEQKEEEDNVKEEEDNDEEEELEEEEEGEEKEEEEEKEEGEEQKEKSND